MKRGAVDVVPLLRYAQDESPLMGAAADEIERLRAGLAAAQQSIREAHKTIAHQRDRLRECYCHV